MLTWQRMLSTWGVPLMIGLAYLGLVRTSDVHGLVAGLLLGVMVVVALLWLMFREMSVHASLSRAAAIGEPDALMTLATAQAARRWTAKSRMPFKVYVAVAHELRGDDALALAQLDEIRANLGAPTGAWALVAARVEIGARLALGDIEAARACYAASFGVARAVPGSPAELFGREARAKLQLADGAAADALPTFRGLADNNRLGPAARAVALVHAARCGDVLGDAPAAARDRAAAAALAPDIWTARA